MCLRIIKVQLWYIAPIVDFFKLFFIVTLNTIGL